jgi:hypothetical protein
MALTQIRRTAVVNLGERQKATGLCGVFGLLGELSQLQTAEILAQSNRCSHGEPPPVRHSASDFPQPGNAHEARFALDGITRLHTNSVIHLSPLPEIESPSLYLP